jgi:hypothetical protein
VPEDSGSGHRRNYTGNFTFDAVVGNGAFTIDLVLAQNAPIGSSIAIYVVRNPDKLRHLH